MTELDNTYEFLRAPYLHEMPSRIDGVVIGRLVDAGRALVVHPGVDAPLRTISTVDLRPDHEGREVALSFVEGDPDRPVVLGLIQDVCTERPTAEPREPVEVEGDGQRVLLTAKEEIVLRCGKASITLTRAGKILIRGAYLSNRSSGVHRIQGGSVQIN